MSAAQRCQPKQVGKQTHAEPADPQERQACRGHHPISSSDTGAGAATAQQNYAWLLTLPECSGLTRQLGVLVLLQRSQAHKVVKLPFELHDRMQTTMRTDTMLEATAWQGNKQS